MTNQDLVIKVLEGDENKLHLKMLISDERLQELEKANQEAWDKATGVADLLQNLGKAATNINELAFMVLQAGAILARENKESNEDSALLEAIKKLSEDGENNIPRVSPL